MESVSQLFKAKGNTVLSIGQGGSVLVAVKRIAQKSTGALLVLEGEQIDDIVSDRDYARRVILHGRASHNTEVREIMSSNVHTVGLARTVEDCMALMTAKGIRHLPVVDGRHVVSMLSIVDSVKVVIADPQVTTRQLESHIHA
jgi:signal-transduction protein with cAMP-binding, CBS, and nucleotidyltransferase domain